MESIAIMVIANIITLFTGLFNTTPPLLVGADWYGFPLAWRFVIIYSISIEKFDFFNYFLDVIFWLLVILLILYLYRRWIKRS